MEKSKREEKKEARQVRGTKSTSKTKTVALIATENRCKNETCAFKGDDLYKGHVVRELPINIKYHGK
jgi:hypothetical protein